ncbi:MAG: sortase, partial [Clostridia bacterium]|nr:sortase [Clostridia bacterium]
FFRTHFSKEGFKRFAENNLPQKDDAAKEKVRKTVRAVSFVALVFSLIYLAFYYHNYRERIKFLKDSEDNVIELENIPDYELDDAWAMMRARYPDVDFPEGMNIKFANLYAISSDVVGWLKIENTDISTVLLQNRDDSYYLYRDIYGNHSRYGNPYVKADSAMGREGLGKNTIIYGHNTHDKLIFNKLENYMSVQGYLNAPIITLDTLYETTKWKIFAVMLTNADPADDGGNYFDYLYSSFPSDEAFMSKMEQIKARSMIHTGVDVQPGDKTLMLYTCYRTIFPSGRLVIVARQLREGESEAINTSLVYYDSSAKFPQAYYGKKNTETTTAAEGASSAQNTTAAPETDAPSQETPSQTQEEQPSAEESAVPVDNTEGNASPPEGAETPPSSPDEPSQEEPQGENETAA